MQLFKRFILATMILLLVCVYTDNAFSQPYNSLFWKISGNNVPKPSYLYGTMHSKDSLVHELGDSVLLKLEECDVVAVEIITDSLDIFSMLTSIFMKDTTLKDLYTVEEYQTVKAYINKHLGLLAFVFNVEKCKPIFISSLLADFGTLTEGESKDKPPADKELILDHYFQEIGQEKEKRIVGIETVDEQLKALDAISLKEQAAMLLKQIEEPKGEDSLMHKMMELYLKQDLDGILKLYETEQAESSKDFHKAVVLRRNYTMAHRIDSLVQAQSTFAAVGALHLPGKEGVINLLKARGYKVEAIVKKIATK